MASSVTNVLRPVYCTIYLAVWGHYPPCWPHINMFIESKWCRGNVMLHIIYLSFILGNGSFWVFIRSIKATFYLYDYFYIIWSNHSLTNFGPGNWFVELLIYIFSSLVVELRAAEDENLIFNDIFNTFESFQTLLCVWHNPWNSNSRPHYCLSLFCWFEIFAFSLCLL